MTRELEARLHEERLLLFSFEKRGRKGDMIRIFQILERLSDRGVAGSVLNYPRVQDT